MGEEVIDRLASMLNHEDHNVRIYVLTALGMVKNPRAAAIALQAALTDTNINVCAAALDVIAASGSAELIPQVNAVANRFPNQPFLAFAARAAIRRIG
jgi:HEAT repeat protein